MDKAAATEIIKFRRFSV